MDTITVIVPPFSPASALTFVLSTSSISRPEVSSYASNESLSLSNGSGTSAEQKEVKPFQWGMLGLTLIIVCTAVGNLLVCLAVCWEKRLQNMTNYFLMSLAIADFLVSLLVMPIGMVVEIFGYFPMNAEICVLWVASDVLMCSASIWHMCTMSMDRYFTLNYPMRYGRNKTRRMVAGKILFVWVVSMAISTPVCIHGFIDTSIVYNEGMCVPVLENFLIYGSIFAFYIPLLIMLVTYVLTIRILWQNQQRMKNIERSDLKPRLAQLTAQCTGFAIPKLLSNLRRPSKSPTASQTSSPTPGSDTRLLRPPTPSDVGAGHINATVSDSDLRSEMRLKRETKSSMTYLSPPTLRPCLLRSTPSQPATDTEESETEPNYFSLLQSSQSCRSLYAPVSTTSSDKSLYRKVHKKQLFQQQQSLQQRHLAFFKHRTPSRGESSPSSPDNSSPSCKTIPPSITTNSSSQFASSIKPNLQQTSTSFDDAQIHHVPVTSKSNPLPPMSSKEPNSIQVSEIRQKEAPSSKKLPKKKRYSKRCKKRRGSLSNEQEKPTHLLEVPALVLNKRLRSNKQQNELTSVLSSAKSDTQVSQAGTGSDANSSFFLSHSKLTKDYKSLEWDRRYFEIQEEMDLCLKGEFNRKDLMEQAKDVIMKTSEDSDLPLNRHKILSEPEKSLPVHLGDPLNVQSCCPFQCSHSAPNSPVNRRLSMSFSSDTESDSSDDEVENENTSDRNNADDDNETSNSSTNDDVITIRLQPPSPKSHGELNRDSAPQTSIGSSSNATSAVASISGVGAGDCLIEMNHSRSFSHCNGNAPNYNSITNGVAQSKPTLICASSQSLSPASSPLPELVISSEGEMTLEETDDTLDGSPKTNRIKLRRPHAPIHPNKHRFKKKNPTVKTDMSGDKYSKTIKRPSFRNTFRIHRGKGTSKHILSKKTASNEKKASKVLGIIFLVFVTLWTPFFAVNMLSATCASCIDNVTQEMMSLFLWMGYIASLANPIIYTMFNTAFRRTFIKILTCKIQRTCSSKGSDNPYMSYTTMLASERRNTMTVVLRDESR